MVDGEVRAVSMDSTFRGLLRNREESWVKTLRKKGIWGTEETCVRAKVL